MHPKIKASTLRRAAEAADGLRNKDVYLRVKEHDFEHHDKEPPASADAVVIRCQSDDKLPPGSRPTILEIKAKTRKHNNAPREHLLHRDYDSIFWTESAVEKFVYPYYARVYGRDAPERLAVIRDAWESDMVFAVAHLPKSEPFDVEGRLLLREGVVRLETEYHVLVDLEGKGELNAFIPELYVLEFLR